MTSVAHGSSVTSVAHGDTTRTTQELSIMVGPHGPHGASTTAGPVSHGSPPSQPSDTHCCVSCHSQIADSGLHTPLSGSFMSAPITSTPNKSVSFQTPDVAAMARINELEDQLTKLWQQMSGLVAKQNEFAQIQSQQG